jgi:hypothetical protein
MLPIISDFICQIIKKKESGMDFVVVGDLGVILEKGKAPFGDKGAFSKE